MKKNSKKTIAQELKSMFSISNGMFAASSIIIMVMLAVIAINVSDFYKVQYVTDTSQMEIRKDVQTINKRLLFALASNDDEITKKQSDDFDERFVKIQGRIETITKNLNDDTLNSDLMGKWTAFEEASYKFLDMVKAKDLEGALEYFNTTYNDVSEALADSLDLTGTLAKDAIEGKFKLIMLITIVSIILAIVMLTSCILISNKRSRDLIKSISDELSILAKASEEIADGNIHAEIEYDSENEIGVVARQLRRAIESMGTYIDEIKDIMQTMAGGNFNIEFQHEFNGDFKEIEEAINQFSVQISESMSEIMAVSEQVSGGADQIAGAGQNLAESCTDQANIVDQLSDMVGTITRQIAENAKEADEISREVDEVANGIVDGNKKMQGVVEAMRSISDASKEISAIIDTINSIADQTNLLSLNASIEAARAGEAGRGFAVVANEVSSLAGQTVEAAKNTTELIQASLNAVSNGIKIADDTAETLNLMVGKVQNISKSVNDVAKSSDDQAEAVKQLDGHIRDITSVGESNAATSQESSALSFELNGQAESLKQLVGQFVIMK